MKNIKKITAVILSAALLGTAAAPAYAKSAPKEKQEVVYVMSDASGKVNDIEVVNIFDGGDITDYGDYSEVKVLNTTDKIKQNGEKVSISSSADKVYYQGTIKTKQIPWNISILYFLDGKEYSASELAGKSGELEIRFSVNKNTEYTGSFYEDYALQAIFTMDAEKCTDITADGATIANVGNDKQISYTILPGKGIDAAIKANVTDFEMDAVAVNGIKLDLGVEINDEELKGKVNELINAVKKLDDGAKDLYAGSGKLKKGSSDLKTGASALHNGSNSLNEGIVKLQSGLNGVQDGLNSLNMQSGALTENSLKFKTALGKFQSELGKIQTETNAGSAELQGNIDTLKTQNANAMKTIEKYEEVLGEDAADLQQIKALLAANNETLGGIETYLNGASGEIPALSEGINQLVENYEKLDSGIGSYTGGVAQVVAGYSQVMDGMPYLATGSKELVSGSGELYGGSVKVYDGVALLCDGAKYMAEGTDRFYSETSGMNDKIEKEIDGILDSIGGNMKNPVSFVSSKNTHVDSVQFVIKTTAIEKNETEATKPVRQENLNFWQKLLRLFGVNR